MKAFFVRATFWAGIILAIAVPSWGAVPLWYDAQKQALAVDPYFDGFGGTIEIDFNADHSSAAIIDQSMWHWLLGEVTDIGLYNCTVTQDPGGGTSAFTAYGWGQRLGSFNAAPGFDTFVRTPYYNGQPATDQFHYFTDEWNVSTGKTVVNVRPATSAGSIPVTDAMLYDTYFRINQGKWKRFTDINSPEPDPIEAIVSVDPQKLNSRSRGKWVTAHIELLSPYSAGLIDLSTVSLEVVSDIKVEGFLAERISIAGPVELTDDDGDGILELMAKFERAELITRLHDGEAAVIISGMLTDGTPFAGKATFAVIH